MKIFQSWYTVSFPSLKFILLIFLHRLGLEWWFHDYQTPSSLMPRSTQAQSCQPHPFVSSFTDLNQKPIQDASRLQGTLINLFSHSRWSHLTSFKEDSQLSPSLPLGGRCDYSTDFSKPVLKSCWISATWQF